MLHHYTFGTHDSAIVLADILNSYDERQVKKICKIFCKSVDALRAASQIPQKRWKHYILTLIKHERFKIIDGMDWEDNLKSHMKAVLAVRYRELLRNDGLIKISKKADYGKCICLPDSDDEPKYHLTTCPKSKWHIEQVLNRKPK